MDEHGNSGETTNICDGDSGDFVDYFSTIGVVSEDSFTAGYDRDRNIDLAIQELVQGARGSAFELNDNESSIIRWSQRAIGKKGGGGKRSAQEKVYVTHEDFEEGEERDSFLLIYGYAEGLFDENYKNNQAESISFFFSGENDQINFEDAANCIDSQIRIDVIRLRIMFEFWIRDWNLILPDDAVSLPDRIEMSAAQHGSMVGIDIAREAWFEPGISRDKLLSAVKERNQNISEGDIEASLRNLVAHHVISESTVGSLERFWTTGKNPVKKIEETLMERKIKTTINKIHWANLF